jgi:hypothetical protein
MMSARRFDTIARPSTARPSNSSDDSPTLPPPDMQRGDFWLVDLDTGSQRKLTDFGHEFIVTDFDVSADGSEIIFDRRCDNSDIVLIDRSGP